MYLLENHWVLDVRWLRIIHNKLVALSLNLAQSKGQAALKV